MKRTVLMIMAVTLLSKIIGFGRELLLSYLYGASNISDAYIIAITIPSVLLGFIIYSIATIYIPLYTRIQSNKGIGEADKYTSNLINILSLILTIILILSIVIAEPLVKIFASGFKGTTLDLAVNFTRISILSIYFIFLWKLFSAYLQIKNSFFITSIIGIPNTIIIAIALLASTKISIYVLPLAIVLGAVLQFIILIPFVLKKGYRHKIFFNFKDDNIKKMGKMSLPVILGLSVNEINVLVDRTIASRIIEGGITALNYARYIDDFVIAIFVLSITTVIFPNISRLAAMNNLNAIKENLRESFTLLNIIIIPASVLFMLFSNPIIALVYKRGAFDLAALNLTSSALFFYSIGMLGVSLRTVLSKFFFSLKDTKTPNITAFIALIINIILNIILSRYLGIGGLALATSIAAIFSTGLMLFFLRKKIGPFGTKNISISFLKILFSSLIMGTLAKLLFHYIDDILNQNLSLIIVVMTGLMIYFVIIYFMKIKEVDVIVKTIKNKIGKDIF